MLTSLKPATEMVSFLAQAKIVAIIRLPDLTNAVELSRALVDGGFRALEITLNSPGALDAISRVRAALPEIERGEVGIGAGTVLTPDEVRASVQAGAQFCISPSTKPAVIEACKREGVTAIPGAFTATEIEAAWDAGADIVKVFPSRAVGPRYIKEIHGPFPQIRLMPTGGIEREMIRDFLAAGAIAVGVGSSKMLDAGAIASGDWDTIRTLAQSFVAETR
jgi:2-dehydro-3-deoxyphosphogluconate aldolase/(4S)-4-hydroxy-2-oxoglutarate aldolase